MDPYTILKNKVKDAFKKNDNPKEIEIFVLVLGDL